MSEIKPNGCKKYYKHHGAEVGKAYSYMYIFEVGAFDRVQIKSGIPQITHSKKNVPTTFSHKYWIWFNVDKEDPRNLSHKSACLSTFRQDWEYCHRYKLKILLSSESIRHRAKVHKVMR